MTIVPCNSDGSPVTPAVPQKPSYFDGSVLILFDSIQECKEYISNLKQPS